MGHKGGAGHKQQQQQGKQVPAAVPNRGERIDGEPSSDIEPLRLLCEVADRSFEAGMPLKHPKKRADVRAGKGQQGRGRGKRKKPEQEGQKQVETERVLGEVCQQQHHAKEQQHQPGDQNGRGARPARAASRWVAAAVQAALDD